MVERHARAHVRSKRALHFHRVGHVPSWSKRGTFCPRCTGERDSPFWDRRPRRNREKTKGIVPRVADERPVPDCGAFAMPAEDLVSFLSHPRRYSYQPWRVGCATMVDVGGHGRLRGRASALQAFLGRLCAHVEPCWKACSAQKHAMEMLELQNQKLAAQLAQRRAEVQDLERQLERTQRSAEARQRHAMAVKRRWMQLHEDLEVLAVQCGLPQVHRDVQVDESDPFLTAFADDAHHVEQENVAQEGDGAHDGPPSTDEALQKLEKKTKDTFASVLRALLSRMDAPHASEDVEDVRANAVAMAEKHRQAAAESRKEREKRREAEDALALAQQEHRDLQNALEDARNELASVRRKLASVETSTKSDRGASSRGDEVGKETDGNNTSEVDVTKVQAAFEEEKAALEKHLETLQKEADNALLEKTKISEKLHEYQAKYETAERYSREDRLKLQTRLDAVTAERDHLAKTAHSLRMERDKLMVDKMKRSSSRDALYDMESKIKRMEEELRVARISRPKAYEKAEQDLLQNVVRVIKLSRQELEALMQNLGKAGTGVGTTGKRKREGAELGTAEIEDGRLEQELTHSKQTITDLRERLRAADEANSAARLGQGASQLDEEVKNLLTRVTELEVRLSQAEEARVAAEEERDAFAGELDGVAMALEDLSTQNKRLLEQLAASSEDQLQLQLASAKQVTELNKLQKAAEDMEEQFKVQAHEVQDSQEKARRAESRLSEMHDRLANLNHRLSTLEEQRDRYRADANSAAAELAKLEQQYKVLKDTADKLRTDQQAAERRAGKDRSRCAILESETKSLKAQVERLKGLIGKDISEVNDSQVKALRQILKCPVCSSRDKEVVITKCYHLFCHQCIQDNLDSRHRKCPGCGVGFGANDVKRVYLS